MSSLVRILIISLLLQMPLAPPLLAADAVSSPEKICPVLVGSPLPQITLETLNGEPFDLTRAISKKPTVLIYYRGGW